MKLSHIAGLLPLLPTFIQAQTLCKKGETDYFSCAVSPTGKVVSICGEVADLESNSGNWIQYRFGKPKAIELAYPTERFGSISKFEGNYFGRYNFVDLRFLSGDTLYSVTLYGPYGGEDAEERISYSGQVSVGLPTSSKSVNIPCRKAPGHYFQAFSELNIFLERHNGESNILQKFGSRATK